ncbi:Cell division control protein [Conglomerata obtusa]
METLRSIKNKITTQSLEGKYKAPLTSKSLIFFLILGIANVALGIILTIIYADLYTITIPYERGNNILNFTLYKPTKNLSFYLQFENFYVSHAYYAKSYSVSQLKGNATTKISSCTELQYLNGKIIYPCGLMANAFNQDSFELFNDNEQIPIQVDDISWSSTKNRVKNTTYNIDDIEAPPLWAPYRSVPKLENNLRFVNWMQQSSFMSFRKLYGKIDALDTGNYKFLVNSDYAFGKTSVVLSENSWVGAKNFFLSCFMIVVGLILIISCLLIFRSKKFFEDI